MNVNNIFNIFNVLSSEPLNAILPSGEKLTLQTQLLCPDSVRSNSPVEIFHTFNVLSAEPLNAILPSRQRVRIPDSLYVLKHVYGRNN